MKSNKTFKETLKKQGRPSEYESAIISIIKEVPQGTHLTAPEVFAKAQELGLPVSISTVYRTLHRLATIGDLSTVSGDRKIRYEAADGGPEHDHLICLGCGLTIEFIDARLPNFGHTVAKRKGFDLIKSRFDVLGYCQSCQKSSTSNKKIKLGEYWLSAENLLKESLQTISKLNNAQNEERKLLLEQSQVLLDNLDEALDLCQSADKLLNRGI